MKLLLVGSASKYAIEKPYLHYFSQHSQITRVSLFAAQDQFLAYYNSTIINKILYRSGLSKILSDINKRLIKLISEEKPDVVFVFKGMEILPETLQWIRKCGIKLVNYNPDNPFIFSGRGSGNKNITQSLPLYDVHFTYNLEIKKQLELQLDAKTAWLPFGFDIDERLYRECEDQEEIVGVSFLGNPDKDRSYFIKSLADNGIPITVFGHHWERFINHNLITIAGPVYGDDLYKMLRKYRVQLNLMRRHNLNSHNMRTFEVPGVGGIMLAPDTEEHRFFFENGKEVFLYKTLRDCIDLIRTQLSISSNQAKQIRAAARLRSLNSGYNYQSRAEQVIEELI
jgi:spore maturation protein CgeB